MVIVVVALLLLNLSIIVYFVHPAFNPDDDDGDVKEPEPEDDWLVPEEPEQLEQDVTWEGQDMFIERPLVLAPNIDLSIRDSDLRIHLEDLMFWLQPAIRVDNGASLDIRDSTIEVYQDPRLAASVVGAYQRPDHHVPYIARVVNLDEAVDPVFHMDVQWLGNGTPVAVGVIPAGGTELVLLDTFTPDEGSSERWHHIQVELADYAGTRPWVVTWFYSYPDAPIFIGNLSVMEGGEWPPGDMFPTGHPMKDGWFASRFSDLPSLQRATFERGRWYGLERSWQPLIESEGDVMISGSSIIEPPGMGRKASGDIHKEDIDPETMMSIDQVGGHGGHIKMVGGSLRLTDSELVNVPVTGLNTSLYAEGSTFRGDHDLVSLHRPDGTFTECDFVTDPLSPDNPFNAYSYRYLWALGIEGGSDDGALEISDNLFSGSHIAIDLSHASVNIEGNTFSHIKGMSIWDHASEGLDWGWLSAHNTFEDHARNIYLKSTVTDVEFVHPDNETEEIQVYSSASIQTWLDLHSPFAGQLRSVYGNQIRYIVPRILIKASGEYQTSRVVHADVTWQHESEAFTFSPSDRQLTIDLSELFKEGPSPQRTLRVETMEVPEETSEGVFQLSAQLDNIWDMDQADPTVRFHVDGVQVLSVPITAAMLSGDDDAVVHGNVSIEPGWHDVNVSIWGRESLGGGNYADAATSLAFLEESFLVLSETNDIDGWMPLRVNHLIVPGGVTALVDVVDPGSPERQFHQVRVHGWNGSSLVMEGKDLGGLARTQFALPTPVTMEVRNATFAYLQIYDDRWNDWDGTPGGPIILSNVSGGTIGISGQGRNISLDTMHVSEYLGVSTDGVSNVSLTNTDVIDGYVDIDMWNGTLSITDCSFRSHWSDSVYLQPFYADLNVTDCTFVGASLMVFFNSWYQYAVDNINVTGCTFTGEDAVLYMGWDLLHVDMYDVDPDFVPQLNGTIEGNVFDGEGAAAVLHHGTVGQLWGDNDLLEGARLHAFYITRLQVIPPDGTPFWGAYDFLPAEGIVTDWPFGTIRWIELDGEILYDVTDDVSKETDPPTLDIVLYGLGKYRHVRGFDQVVPNEDNDEATYPVMPDFFQLLREQVAYWPPLEGLE